MKTSFLLISFLSISLVGCNKTENLKKEASSQRTNAIINPSRSQSVLTNPVLPNPISSYKKFIHKVMERPIPSPHFEESTHVGLINELDKIIGKQIKLVNVTLSQVNLFGSWEKEDGKYYFSFIAKDEGHTTVVHLDDTIINGPIFQMIHASNKFDILVEYRLADYQENPEGIYLKAIKLHNQESLIPRQSCFHRKDLQFMKNTWTGDMDQKCINEIDILSYKDISDSYYAHLTIDLSDNSTLKATD